MTSRPRRVELRRLGVDRARLGDERDLLARDADVEHGLGVRRDHEPVADHEVDHVAPLSEAGQHELGPARDPPLVLGQVGVDRAVEVASAGAQRGPDLGLDLRGRAREHEALAQVLADAEPVGELDVAGLLLLRGMAVRLQVVRLPDLEQRRPGAPSG